MRAIVKEWRKVRSYEKKFDTACLKIIENMLEIHFMSLPLAHHTDANVRLNISFFLKTMKYTNYRMVKGLLYSDETGKYYDIKYDCACNRLSNFWFVQRDV